MRPFWSIAVPVTAAMLLPASLGMAQTASGTDAQVITPPSSLEAVAPEMHALFEAIRLYEHLDIIAAEGLASAPDLEKNMFPGQGGAAWQASVTAIYAADRLAASLDAAAAEIEISDADLATLNAFFQSPTGQAIADGELAGRQALLNNAAEQAAIEAAQERLAEGDPRMDLLTEFIGVNDLVERNVSGSLNSSFAFYRGLVDGNAFGQDIPETLMLAEVWSQEAEVRQESQEWLYGFQLLAYDGLTDAQMEEYIALSRSSAGRAFNQLLFGAFDTVYGEISYELGLAAAVFISGEET